MGVVVEAIDETDGHAVALKVLHDSLRAQPLVAARFLREADAARALTTPHAVRVETAGVADDGTHYLVMELLAGEDLASLARRLSPMPVERALSIVDQVAEALADAHANGVVHRDLKPQNVFLVPDVNGEIVKLVDFGVSKIVSREEGARLTLTGHTLGTPHYMAPEQLRATKDLDGRADVYALGIVLFELLAGVRPYDGATHEEVILKIATEDAPRLAELRPDLPPGLVEVVARAMHRDRARRVASMDELRAALRPHWSGERVIVEGSTREHAAPRSRRGVAPLRSTFPSSAPEIVAAAAPSNTTAGSSPRARRTWLAAGAALVVLVAVVVAVASAWPRATKAGSPRPTATSRTRGK